MSGPLLDVHVRRKAFADKPVLQDLRLRVGLGEIVGLVGASGCGKSTLLRIAAGLDTDFEGSVRLEGALRHAPDRDVGFIFQEPRLFPWLSVAENVAFGLGRAGRGDPRVEALLAEVGLPGFGDRLPKQLSGGQAQRVGIARGLFEGPRLLLLDEPFSAVDAFTRIHLQAVLAQVARRHGLTVLLVTHDVEEAVMLCDRVLVLEARAGAPVRELAVPLSRPRVRDGEPVAGHRRELLAMLHAVHAF